MSSKNKSQLRTENNSSFPNNNSQFITPQKLRDFNADIIDSMVSNEDSGSFASGDTGSLLETASFNNGTRLMTFTKGDSSTFDVSIPDSTLDSGSFITTASVSDATITFTKGDGQTFQQTINNVVSASHAVNSVSASHAEQADNSTSASQAVSSSVVSDPNIAYINKDNTFTGTQSFTNISVAGTGSFGRIEAVTGSAKIIGDAFVVVNADTPALKYAGLKVFDSGSGATASFEWDGDEDSWILVEEGGQSAFVLTGPTGSKGSEANLSLNTLPKAGEHRQLLDSSISDNGSTITLGRTTNVSGPLSASNLSSIEITRLQESGSDDKSRIDALSLETGSYLNTGSASQTKFANIVQNFDGPAGPFGSTDVIKLNVSEINGINYNNSHFGVQNAPSLGNAYQDAFIIEVYDSFAYNFGAEMLLNGSEGHFGMLNSGSNNKGTIRLRDLYDGNNQLDIQGQNINIGTLGTGYNTQNLIIGRNSVTNTEFKGSQTFSGGGGDFSLFDHSAIFNTNPILSASVVSPLDDVSISSNTASFDLNTSPTKTVTLVSGSTTHLDFSNATTGQSVTILVKQPGTGTGSIEMNPNVKEPLNNMYTASAASSAEDILTVTTFDSAIYVVNSLRMTS